MEYFEYGGNICQHEILLSTNKVKFTKIEGVSHTWPSSDKTILLMLQMEVNDVWGKVSTAERNEEVEAAHLWSPKAGIRAKVETCSKGLCELVASIVLTCSLDCIFYKKDIVINWNYFKFNFACHNMYISL